MVTRFVTDVGSFVIFFYYFYLLVVYLDLFVVDDCGMVGGGLIGVV